MGMKADNLKPKIMIANEGIIDVSLIETALSNYGMTNVISTTDSKKVSDMVNKYKPDLLLLDLDMPNVDEMDILQHVKQNISDNSTAIIACSEKEFDAQNIGVYAVISKPFRSAQAMMAIWGFLKKSYETKVS